MKLDLALFLNEPDEDLVWLELQNRLPTVRCIESEWTGDGSPLLAESISRAKGTQVFLWIPRGEVTFVRGSNRLVGVHLVRSLFSDGEMLAGRLATRVANADDEYGQFVHSVVAAVRSVARPDLMDLNGVRRSKYLIGPSTRSRVASGEIEHLRDRAVTSQYLRLR